MMQLKHLIRKSFRSSSIGKGVNASTFSPVHGFILEKPCRLCRRKRRAAAAVEFALILPLLFILLFGMIEMGRAIMVQQVLTNSAREGCRQAILDGAVEANVTTTVNNYLSSAGITGATVTITPNPLSSAGYGVAVSVTVNVPFSQVSWLGTPIYLKDKSLSASTVMRRETVQ